MKDQRHAFLLLLSYLLLGWAAPGDCDEPKGDSLEWEAIDTSGFSSSMRHWRELKDESRFIQAIEGQGSYSAKQVPEIVENILLFQREDGGWPKDYDMTAILTPEQREKVVATRANHDSSYDNGNLHSQVDYLARAYAQHPDVRMREATEKGLDFMLQSQYAHGGFPQRYPNAKSFHAHITLNDGAMIGIMRVLRSVGKSQPHFAWLDDDRRTRARDAVRKAVECLLLCQIQVESNRTGWCQQHDENNFQARPARTFELASLCPQETTEVVCFLMEQDELRPTDLAAMDSAIDWLKTVRIAGLRLERVAAEEVTFLRHKANFDVVAVIDPIARPIWARHYEIGTNRPIFAGRDGIKKYDLSEIERERRTGTVWYGHWPEKLLKDYAAWRRAR